MWRHGATLPRHPRIDYSAIVQSPYHFRKSQVKGTELGFGQLGYLKDPMHHESVGLGSGAARFGK
jgi:hypothetical protein